MKKNLCTVMLLVTGFLLVSAHAVDNIVYVSTFSSGQGISKGSTDTCIHSLIGQTFTGRSSSDSSVIYAGYYNFPFIQTAILNDPPTIVSPDVDTAYKGNYYSYHVQAYDPDNKTLSFSFYNLPYGFVGQGDSVFSYLVMQSVDTSFMIVASDGYLFDTIVVSLQVSLGNKPFEITSPLLDNAVEDEKYFYTPTSNYDNDVTVTIKYDYRYSHYPAWLTPVVGANGITSLVGTPLEGAQSTSFIVKAVNKADTTQQLDIKEVVLVVLPVNDSPFLTLPVSISAVAQQEFQYRIIAEDVDDTLLTFLLQESPPSLAISQNGLLHSWIPSDSLVGSTDTVSIVVKDPMGASDTGSFAIEIIAEGTPYCLNVGPIANPARDSIKIPFELKDKNYDTLSMSIKYYTPDGAGVVPKTLLGKTSGIDSSGYTDTLVWVSYEDFKDTIVDSILIEIIPGDGVNNGPPFRTNRFSINNTTALIVSTVTPLSSDTVNSFYGRYITATFAGSALDTASLDHSTILINGSVSGAIAYSMIKSGNAVQCVLNEFPYGGEDITVTVSGAIKDINNKTLDGNGNGLFEGVGIDDYFLKYRIAKLGDFDLNDTIGGAIELSCLASYWYGSATDSMSADSIVKIETGPAVGIAPYLKVTPDSAFDFEDLCDYLHMWYWSVKSGTASVKGSFASRLPANSFNNNTSETKSMTWDNLLPDKCSQPEHNKETSIQHAETVDEYSNAMLLFLDVKNVTELVSCEYRIVYDTKYLAYTGIQSNGILDNDNGEALVMENSANGYVDLCIARLSAKKPCVSGDGRIVSFRFRKSSAQTGNISIAYTLVNRTHETIESGVINLNGNELSQENASTMDPVQELTVIPNPCKTARTPSDFRITDEISFLKRNLNRHGGALITFVVSGEYTQHRASLRVNKLETAIALFDAAGNRIIETPVENVFSLLRSSQTDQRLGVYWNGSNTNGRTVGNGIYRVVLTWKTNRKSGMLSAFVGVND